MPNETEENWVDEETIKQQNFRDGIEVERDRERSPDLQHVGAEGSANATTLYAEDVEDEPLPNSKFATRKTKAEREWRLNCGLDSHNCGRERSRWKTNIEDLDRPRLVEPLTDRLELGEGATDRAKELARTPCPNGLNLNGGLDVWLVAIVLYAANEQKDVLRLDYDALDDIKDEFEIDDEQIRAGMNRYEFQQQRTERGE